MKKALLLIALFLITIMITGCTGPLLSVVGGDGSSDSTPLSKGSSSFSGDKAQFDLYVMSQCPFGTQVQDALIPVAKKFGDDLELNIDFIADEQGDGFRSLHGEKEVNGDIVQLCTQEHNPDQFLDMISCMNENAAAIPDNWESCANKLSLNKEAIGACYEGEQGKELFRSSIKRTKAASATASPTMFINGVAYNGGRTELDFHRAICGAMSAKHPACEDMPVCASAADCTAQPDKIGSCMNPGEKEAECVYTNPVNTKLTVINSKDCATCDTTAIEAQLKQLFKGMSSETVDVSSAKGKQLVEDLDLAVVPAFFFDMNVKQTATWKSQPQMGSAFEEKAGGMLVLNQAIGSTYFIDDQKRTQHYESIGVTKGDNRPQIDFFVMSYCPFGNQAEEAIEGAFQELKGVADFNPRWVIYSNYQGGGSDFCLDSESKYCSMHGVAEMNQDIREDCVNQLYNTEKFFEFALAMNKECTYENADTCWEGVASGMGIDTAQVESCFDSKKLDIAARDKALGDKLGVQGSPTVFVDGDEYNGPRTAEGYTAALCAAFDEKPAECAGVPELSEVQAAPAAATANIGGGCAI